MLKLIKARLEGAKGAWPEELLGVLWAYGTTARTPTRETPLKLVFGTEAVISVEVGLSSLRRAHYNKISNNDELRLSLDFIFEVRDEAAQRMAQYQQKMAMYHNQRLKLKRFDPDDMVSLTSHQRPNSRKVKPYLGKSI